MSQSIDMICTLTGCNYEMACEAFNETGDVTLAVDKILFKTELPVKKKPKTDETQEEIKKIREVMKELDKKMDERPDSTINQFSTLLSRREREESVLTPTHLLETVLQNNYSQECQLPVLEEEVEKQETVCQ
jgi:hypothetical protein